MCMGGHKLASQLAGDTMHIQLDGGVSWCSAAARFLTREGDDLVVAWPRNEQL
jgi:hypothetical protein